MGRFSLSLLQTAKSRRGDTTAEATQSSTVRIWELALVISSQFLGWRMPISAVLQRRSRHKWNESLLARARAMCAHLVTTLSRVSHLAISNFHAQPMPPPHQAL